MCVDYRKINKLQPEVTNADGGKGCISLIPLPKIDELYAKLKGYKVFSSLDLRSGYYHIRLTETAKPKSAFVLSSLGKYQFNRPGGMATAKFAGRGRGDPKEQFADDPFEIADEDLPDVLEDADKPKGGEPSTSKPVGKKGEAQTEGQAAEGAQAPPEGIPPAPIPVPTDPLPGTSTGPTQDPTVDPTLEPTQTPRRGRNKAYSVCQRL